MHETHQIRGALTLQVIDRAGKIVSQRQYSNRIVTSGRRMVAEMFGGLGEGGVPAPVKEIGVGNDATPPTDEDTALKAERARKPIESVEYVEYNEPVPGSEDSVVQRIRVRLQTVLDYDEANNNTTPLQEAGIFNADGLLYNRVVFEPVKKTKSFKLTLVWEITF